ncbi:hypothetical protein OJ998_03025 [Solirubrobacter taibaiensis]|nr:hypothetical protein [Solirubrobacter taibaiensis]
MFSLDGVRYAAFLAALTAVATVLTGAIAQRFIKTEDHTEAHLREQLAEISERLARLEATSRREPPGPRRP